MRKQAAHSRGLTFPNVVILIRRSATIVSGRHLEEEIIMYRGYAIATAILSSGLGLLGLSGEAAGQASRMVTLTDGTKMDNFDQAGNASWRVAERAIAADRGNGFLVTKDSYGDFKLRAEFYSDEGTNSGVFIRCDNPQQPSAQSCYEVQINDGNPNRGNATGAIINAAQVDRVPQTELKWNVIEIEAKGPQLNVSVNGERTASVRDTKHARGRIALQYASGVIYWRKVEIQPLSAQDIAAEDEAIHAYCQAGFAIIFPANRQQETFVMRWPQERAFPRGNFFRRKGRQPIFRDLDRLRDGAIFGSGNCVARTGCAEQEGRGFARGQMSSWD